jgi:hypothetical protein
VRHQIHRHIGVAQDLFVGIRLGAPDHRAQPGNQLA